MDVDMNRETIAASLFGQFMEEELANLNLLDDEEEEFQGESVMVDSTLQNCLVGRYLTDSVVHFLSICNTMADLWHPIGGVCITNLGEKRYLFQFFHEVDVQRVLVGVPWFFNNHLLILQWLPNGEDPVMMVLNFVDFWVQVHDLPPELMNETIARQFGDFYGKFLDYDTSIPPMGYKSYMRIRVLLDVSAPLKRKKNVQIGKSKTVYVHFKYDKFSLFCFICGKLGHGESYCPYHLKVEPSKIIFGWDLSLRVAVRRRNVAVSRWLCEADGSRCKAEKRESNNQGMNCNEEKDIRSDSRKDIENQQINPNLIPWDLIINLALMRAKMTRLMMGWRLSLWIWL
ncbi:hypothetical protein J1N35_029624 [Gossypium stocksii]|uniref:CCHC-type domain-containing protein n=1 Tax=Gossypium stocksii TaxID=47602 RepID=A0A9D3UY37_9ROSI|nr:hypothetical protein J1N35_029624 [Gossypium stocksii]